MTIDNVVQFLCDSDILTLNELSKQLVQNNSDIANDLEFMLSIAIKENLLDKELV